MRALPAILFAISSPVFAADSDGLVGNWKLLSWQVAVENEPALDVLIEPKRLSEFGYRGARSFADYLSRPSIDSAFPDVVVLIHLYLAGQLTCFTIKTDINDLRIFVSVRRNLYRLGATDSRCFEGFYFLLGR